MLSGCHWFFISEERSREESARVVQKLLLGAWAVAQIAICGVGVAALAKLSLKGDPRKVFIGLSVTALVLDGLYGKIGVRKATYTVCCLLSVGVVVVSALALHLVLPIKVTLALSAGVSLLALVIRGLWNALEMEGRLTVKKAVGELQKSNKKTFLSIDGTSLTLQNGCAAGDILVGDCLDTRVLALVKNFLRQSGFKHVY